MKKLTKLSLPIPLIIIPLTLTSCNKWSTANKVKESNKNDDTNQKLKLIKDLIFIHRNLDYEDENDKTKFRSWIGDMIINQKPQKNQKQ